MPPEVTAPAEATSLFGIPPLTRFWTRQLALVNGAPDPGRDTDWVADNTLLAGLRLGLRETYDYLLRSRPTLAAFEAWILEKNGGAIDGGRIERLRAALAGGGISTQPADPAAAPALSPADLEFWTRNGYVIIHDAVPPEDRRSETRRLSSHFW